VGGYLIDLSATRRWDLPGDAQFSLSAGLNGAGDRFMQTWHGITPAQAAASGLAPFQAAEGLREAHVSAVWRKELGPHWAGFAGLSAHRLLGSAADSPLTTQTSGWAASAALVWRFGGGR
jgi:MipA family protein